jgi:hypothetical protein
VIVILYSVSGSPPTSGEAWLNYLAGKTMLWWAIIGLSILTDLLLAPFALSMYLALRRVDRNLMLVATFFTGLFILLDLAVTWPNYSSLVSLSNSYAVTTDSTQRAAYTAAADYASAVLSSPTIPVYNTLTLSLGILITGIVMLKGVFRKSIGYLGILTGIVGSISVIGAWLVAGLGSAIIIASVLTLVWVFFAGYSLIRLR